MLGTAGRSCSFSGALLLPAVAAAVSAEDLGAVAYRPGLLSAGKAWVSTVCADCCAGGVQGRLKNPHNAELWLAAVRVEQRAGNIKAAESLMAR